MLPRRVSPKCLGSTRHTLYRAYPSNPTAPPYHRSAFRPLLPRVFTRPPLTPLHPPDALWKTACRATCLVPRIICIVAQQSAVVNAHFDRKTAGFHAAVCVFAPAGALSRHIPASQCHGCAGSRLHRAGTGSTAVRRDSRYPQWLLRYLYSLPTSPAPPESLQNATQTQKPGPAGIPAGPGDARMRWI